MPTPRWSILFRRIRGLGAVSSALARYSAGRHPAGDRSVAGHVLDPGRAAAAAGWDRGRHPTAAAPTNLPPPWWLRVGAVGYPSTHLSRPLWGMVFVGYFHVALEACRAEVGPGPAPVAAAHPGQIDRHLRRLRHLRHRVDAGGRGVVDRERKV